MWLEVTQRNVTQLCSTFQFFWAFFILFYGPQLHWFGSLSPLSPNHDYSSRGEQFSAKKFWQAHRTPPPQLQTADNVSNQLKDTVAHVANNTNISPEWIISFRWVTIQMDANVAPCANMQLRIGLCIHITTWKVIICQCGVFTVFCFPQVAKKECSLKKSVP